jgi:uncharacterized repeat protein (TIGR02543 family)
MEGEDKNMVKSRRIKGMLLKVCLVLLVLTSSLGIHPALAEGSEPETETTPQWRQETDVFSSMYLSVAAQGGTVLRATRAPGPGFNGLGVFRLEDGEWLPYGGNDSFDRAVSYNPYLFYHDNTLYVAFDYDRDIQVKRYENGQWINVGNSFSTVISKSIKAAADESGTMYLAFIEQKAALDLTAKVKKLIDDGSGNPVWADVGDLSYFSSFPIGSESDLELVVHDGKVYVGFVCVDCNVSDRYREPMVFMLDESEESGEWTRLTGNQFPLVLDDEGSFEAKMFAMTLVQGVPHVAMKTFLGSTTIIRRYQDGEWLTVYKGNLGDPFFPRLAEYNGMLYMAYTENYYHEDLGSKVWLKRWNGESWETLGGGPAMASDSKLLAVADLDFDEMTRTWYVTHFYSEFPLKYHSGMVHSIQDDAPLQVPPVLKGEDVKLPGQPALISVTGESDIWRSSVRFVRNGSTILTEGTDYAWMENNLLLFPGALHAGVNQISVTASVYANATAIQLVRPYAPEPFRVEQAGYGYVDIAWDAPPEADAYVIAFQAGNSEPANITISDPAVQQHRLTGLDANAVYTLSIRSVKDGVESLPSAAVNAEPKRIPDGMGKLWEHLGGMFHGYRPTVTAEGDELWVAAASADYKGLSVYRYDSGDWVPVGTPGFVDVGLEVDLALDGGTPYVAFEDRGNDFKLKVMRWDGEAWQPVGNRAFTEPVESFMLAMAVHDGVPHVAYAEADKGPLRVKAYVEDAGDGSPGWIDVWPDDQTVVNVSAVQLMQRGGNLYLAYAVDSPTTGYQVHVHVRDLADETGNWREVPFNAGIQPNAYLDLGIDADDEGNLYVAATGGIWKYSVEDQGSWLPLGKPDDNARYPRIKVIDGEPFVAFTHDGRAHVYKFVHGGWYRVGDTLIGHSGDAGGSWLAEMDGLPIIAFDNGSDQVEVHRYAYDLATVTVVPNDGKEPYHLTVRMGEPMAELDSLTRDDYIFQGWLDENGDVYDFSSVITGPLTLEGHWKLVTPGGLSAEESDRTISLSWTPIESATKYVVHYSEHADLSEASVKETASAQIEIGGLANGTTYFFAVRAFDAKYESDLSPTLSASPMTVPSAPRNVRVTEGDGQLSVAFEEPEDDGGRPIETYHVYLDGEHKWSGVQQSADITGLVNRQVYKVTVTAENEAGEGEPSDAVEGMPHKTCTIMWYLRNDTFNTMEEIVCGDLLQEPDPPQRTGYRFEGWHDYWTGLPFDFSSPIETMTEIEGRWSIVPEELADHEWHILNDFSGSFTRQVSQLETASADGILFTATAVSDYSIMSSELIVSQFDRNNGWQELGRFDFQGTVMQFATDDRGDLILALTFWDGQSKLQVKRYSRTDGTWTDLLQTELTGSARQVDVGDDDAIVYYADQNYSPNPADWSTIPHLFRYTVSEEAIDLTDGLIGEEGMHVTNISAMLRYGGDLYFAYADKDLHMHVKRLEAGGWTELGSLETFGKVNTKIQLAGFKGNLLLVVDAASTVEWDGESWSLRDELLPGGTLDSLYTDDAEGLFAVYVMNDADNPMKQQLVVSQYKNDAWVPIGSPINPAGDWAANTRVTASGYIPFVHYQNMNFEHVIRGYYVPVCSVTFDPGDFGSAASVTVPCGEPVGEPERPARTGYAFMGWYASPLAGEPWQFADPVTHDMTLVPKWKWHYAGASLPVDLKVTAGKGRAELEWNRLDLVSDYHIYLRKANEPYGDSPVATVSVTIGEDETEDATDEQAETITHTLTGLRNGTTYAVKLVIRNEEGETAESEEQTFKLNEPSSKPPAPEQDEESYFEILLNGKPQPAGIVTFDEADGRSVIAIKVLDDRLTGLLREEEDGVAVVIAVSDDAQIVRSRLTGTAVNELEAKQADIELQAGTTRYRLPATALKADELSGMFPDAPFEDLAFEIEIEIPPVEEQQAVNRAIAETGASAIGTPIAFKITVHHGDQAAELTMLAAFTEKWLEVPDGADAESISTAVVVEADGSLRHVPTRIVTVDGRRYAVAFTLTNSLYALIRHETSFADIGEHWAKPAIADLGNRMVVFGRANGRFAPDVQVTRAEFAAMLVRALGLKPAYGETLSFSDAAEAGGLAAELATAHHYRLMQGFGDGTARPKQTITREQAFTMVVQAIRLARPGFELRASGKALPFTDRADISSWAVPSVSYAHEAGLASGNSRNELKPKAGITRAETASIIHRMLNVLGWID